MKALVNGKLFVNESIVEEYILLFDAYIVDVVHRERFSPDQNIEIIDAAGHFVSAGFIDLHIHGSGGADVMDATPEALQKISETILQTGTTSFLATTMTMSTEAINNALQNVKIYGKEVTGANILGLHLEGPFINPAKHGAQDACFVQRPNFELIAAYMDEVKMITLAPEVEGAGALIRFLKEYHPKVILSIGHSDADYEVAQESFRAGISHATHLFNAMNAYHHRKPGVIGAVFNSEVTCDIIPDLVHTHPSALELAFQVKREKLMLITDAMRAGCMKNGTYELGGRKVFVKENKAELEDGTLAGSVLKLNEGLKYMQENTSMSIIEVVHSVTKLPAKKLGVKKGELREGYDADIVVFDKDFSIMLAIVKGEERYLCSDF